jgi:putative flippase GtrA
MKERFPLPAWFTLHLTQGAKFAVCGVIGMMVDLGTLGLLVESFGISRYYASFISTGIAICFVFLGNKYLTFKSGGGNTKGELLRFLLVYCIAFFLNGSITSALIYVGVYYIAAKIIAIAIGALWNYVLLHFFVFL